MKCKKWKHALSLNCGIFVKRDMEVLMKTENFIENAKEILENIGPDFLKVFDPCILKHPKHLFGIKNL